MPDDVTYNLLIIFRKNASLICQNVKKSFIERGNLLLILEDSKKITISGKSIDTAGYKNRIHELVSMAKEKGFDITKKSVKHYAKEDGNEYVLVRW